MALRKAAAAGALKKHDYVVVGAGSAGCVLAHRLTKETGASVLLLEAGRSNRGQWDSWKNQIPAALTFNLANDKYNWDYHTVPQKGLDGRALHQPRGKILGGSSALNAMAYVRGHALDFERWSKEIGSDEWDYKHILPYYKKAQKHTSETGGDTTYRGTKGPLEVSRKRSDYVRPINDAFIEAGLQAGYPRAEDMNGYQQEGFGEMDMTVDAKGERASTAHMYLWPILKPKTEEDRKAAEKLTVLTMGQATKIIFEGDRAVGIEYEDEKGTPQQALAKEEVILSAGAVGSPQLLMTSGIGPAAHLESLGIDVRQDLPVGENLQDHLEFYIQFLAKHTSLYPYAATFGGFGELSRYLFRKPWNAVEAGLGWFILGKGMSATNHFEVGGFIRSAPGKAHPDVQYHFIPGCVVGQLDFLPEHGYQAHCGTMRPTSRGTIRLASKDPKVAPLIDPNFLATPDDIEDQRNAFRLTLEILGQKAFDDFRLKPFSPEGDMNVDDDATVDAWIRKHSHSGYHLSCTCAMGSVVDEAGRVKGVQGLRVVDASVMPSMTSGNLNAPTIMLAEKLADAIGGKSLPPQEDATWYVPKDWETKQR
mmetsp:Transcript_22038/g.48144  ORF Transcript_22038/g.48144 Transcript_22038/m.48144 type:complete len:592 (+) Transcript_22038:217-1992(+)|eukprot:CAMPEP_0206433946 /NCGR_PEP_ID=MMETSP0324_2-20121206/8827_1 /ASSEMBLY_ACC=CAM_ASM_000836 /TAXON_ID=2866 /ORGANISM="Crypthecodinium cohnii, Strain Seligo" /LENGTH=591 /DNA_ID=CAMNT_0053900291 /DNA_START=211 /DNA_END=1986 /DNA_ORIENTATION=+